jgi:hypothetical protein
MSPTVKRIVFVLAGALVAALPQAFPALAPFGDLFAGIAGALGGGALIQRPGDMKGGAS